MADAASIIEQVLTEADLDWESPNPGNYVVKLPGTRKLSTTVSLLVGKHSLSLNAFVIRHPDENEPGVHRWLLERNLKLYGVSYAVDRLGDVYVTSKLPLRDHPGGDRPSARLGPGGGRRRLQHPAGAGFRVGDPQGVRLARVPGRVDPQPGRVRPPDPASYDGLTFSYGPTPPLSR